MPVRSSLGWGLFAGASAVLVLCFVGAPVPRIGKNLLAVGELAVMGQALESYAVDHGGLYPTDIAELLERPDGTPGYHNGRTTVPADPWKRPYAYSASADRRAFTLACYGADGAPGGSGPATDFIVVSNSPMVRQR